MPRNSLKTLLILGLPLLLAALYLALVARHTYVTNDGYVGALLDDTWIHVRFAHHIAQGQGLAYNPGVVTPGATSPLWVLILAAIYALTDPALMTQVHIALGLSAAGTLLTVGAITGFGWWISGRAWVGLLAGVITALTGRLTWMGLSGMEITTFTALCIFALWSHTHDVRQGRVFGWRTGIVTALATLARPEGYLLALVIGLDAFVLVPLLRQRLDLRHWWGRVYRGWRGMIAYVLLAGSYPLVCLLLTGFPLPNTYRVKSQLGREWPDLPYAFFWTPRTDHGWLLILLAGLGIGFVVWRMWTGRDRTGFAWALWPLLFVVAVLFMGPDHYVINHARYVAPAIPFHSLAAAVGLWALADVLAARIAPAQARMAALVVGVGLAALALYLGRGTGAAVANDSAQLQRMHVEAGHWLAQNTQPGDIIALNDVGAIAHISDRRVLDMVGLVSPEITDAIRDDPRFSCPHDLQIARVMLEQRPALVAVFNWFFPCLTAWEGALQPFTQFTITGPTVIAGGEMIVYWPVWERWPVQPAIPDRAESVEADFDDGIGLRGYEVAAADDHLTVTLWWQPAARPAGDYTVFVHLIDAEGEILSQHDSRPQRGQFHTNWWRPGDIIADAHTLTLSDDSRQQAHALRLGLYPTGGGPRLGRIAAPIGQEDLLIIELAPDDLTP